MCKVSVIIPVYNVEKYLRQCIESVLAQGFKDYEVILVDDGSTDSCPAICDEYAKKYPFITVIHQENRGLGGARNTGMLKAKGEYLLFLDSDDYIQPELLSICCKKAYTYDCDMVIFDHALVYEDGTCGKTIGYDFLKGNTLLTDNEVMPFTFISGAWNRLIKKELFIKGGVKFPDRVWFEDLRTMPKLSINIKKAYYYNEKPLYYYLQRSGSIMHSGNAEKMIFERLAAINEIIDFYKDNELYEKYRQELDWICVFHGFLLPAREILHFRNYSGKAITELYKTLKQNVTAPTKNKYFTTLSKKEKTVFFCLTHKIHPLLRFILKMKNQ